MKSKTNKSFPHIVVNDIFEDLSEENKRLNKELMFANNCLNVLKKFKTLLNEFYVKFESNIDLKDKQKLIGLEEEFNCTINTEICPQITEEVNDEVIENTNDSNEEKVEENPKKVELKRPPLYVETNERSIRKTKRKVNAIPTNKESKSSDCPKRSKIVIPKPEEEPNSMLLLRRDNYDPNTKSYICPNPCCERSLETKKKLFHHFLNVHHVQKKYLCDHLNCNKSFKSVTALRFHSVVHSDIRPFACDFDGCHFRSKTQNTLNKHQIIHTDVKAFKCNVCGKCVKTQSYLNIHLKSHKSDPSFVCSTEGCGQAFHNRKLLRNHKVMAHNVVYTKGIYRCDWPGCDWSGSGSVTRHISLHTGHKKFKCDWPQCGKSFREQGKLDDHINIHKDLRPYQCVWPGCDYTCPTNSSLRHHSKVHQKSIQ